MLIPKLNCLLKASRLFLIPSLLTIVQSCSNNPIGQELSNSFDSPIDINSDSKVVENINPQSLKDSKKKAKEPPIVVSNKRKTVQKSSFIMDSKNKRKTKTKEKKSNFIPQPYRITIKLSAANPSAPAEMVTKALRTAGVSFEVEKIELIREKELIKDSRSGRSRS